MNIKSFFRVSKTTPAITQKVVVQMLEMPASNQPTSLRSSLRSSSAKRAANGAVIPKNCSVTKNEIAKNDEKKEKLVPESDGSDKTEKARSEVTKVVDCEVALETLKMIPHDALTPLTITTPDKSSSDFPLSSPSNSSLISPTSNSNVPKKKKKLNDCIAMLTCKIQEKLGVNFFEKPSGEPKPSAPNPQPSSLITIQEPKAESKPSMSFQIDSLLKESTFSLPVQDEVIDLSIKKKPLDEPKIEKVESDIPPFVETAVVISQEISELPKPKQIELAQVSVEVQIVPIPCEPKVEAADSTMPDEEKSLPVCLKSEEHVAQDDPVEVPPKVTEIIESVKQIPVETKSEVVDAVETASDESLKISIPKDKIPNLKEILDQYQVITVNNIKISESERRAFEEQKNRILQILNKTNSLTRKISKKATPKKATKRRAPARKPPARRSAAKKPEVVKPKTEEKVVTSTEAEIVEAKIEEVIKTTNRIRCRRLSVVVDPIINLAAFQNKNRKIRLTNNSQQNGFYELLAASEQFFSSKKPADETAKVETIVKPTQADETQQEVSKESEAKVVDAEVKEIVEEVKPVTKTTRAAKSSVKELKNLATEDAKEVMTKKLEPAVKSRGKISEKKLPAKAAEPEKEKIVDPVEVSPEPVKTPSKKAKPKKQQNVENIATPTPLVEPIEKASNEIETKAEAASVETKPKEKPKATPKKSNIKTAKKNLSPLEEIKVEQSVRVENVKEQPDRKKKVTRGKQPTKAENLLDISFSSDTSNENDIPLAQLIVPAVDVVSEKTVNQDNTEKLVASSAKALKENDSKAAKPKAPKASKVIEKPEEVAVEKPVIEESQEIVEVKEISIDKLAEKILENHKPVEPEMLEVHQDEPIEKLQPFLNKTSSTIDLSSTSDVDTRKSFDPFTINEDSFFNDDLDNDPSDKINDIVNNIINSSEFQIDSDTEKSEVYQANDDHASGKSQKAICTICKRTFRNEKVLEKHCLSSTHIMKVERKHRGIARTQERLATKTHLEPAIVKEKAASPILDETKVFRTKGALKTFDTVLDVPVAIDNEKPKPVDESKPAIVAQPQQELTREQKLLNANEDKLYYEFKMEKKPEDMTPKDKDQLFDSLFNSLEAKAQEKQALCYTPKSNFLVATPQDSEMESSSTSWDLKHDADIEWEAENPENVPFANAIKERYPKKFPVKINKSKDTAVSIPTKSLIMGKIFKKHRDREKQKTPQAEAPNNKPGIKNSLDEIFDHLKNSAEIDDKVLTCPSPKTLLKSAGGTFSPNSSNSNDMLETASHSNNNNIYVSKAIRTSPEQDDKKVKVDVHLFNDSMAEDGDDGIGKRKSRRRCAIKAKTFAETWSSDEYEELHDTADIISIINEIEKRELKKRKPMKTDSHLEVLKKADANITSDLPVKNDKVIVKTAELMLEKKSTPNAEIREKSEKKKSVQLVDDTVKPEKASNSIKKRRLSAAKDGHKSDDETFTASKDFKPLKPCPSIKKRRMSCFVPSTTSFDEKPKAKPTVAAKPIKEPLRIESETLKKFENENHDFKAKSSAKKADSEKSFKNQKKFASLLSNFGGHQSSKKKVQKHRKRPRNKVKNIAYDSDSDFELNVSKKSKASAFSERSSSESEEEEENDDVIPTPKPSKSQAVSNASRSSNTNDMTMIKEPKLLPNDLKHVVDTTTTTFKAAIPEDILDSSQSGCNRTKRHSSEKLYYWSSSSSESDQEQGDTADGDNDDSVVPHQPEQHGWIVGDSHKKLVTLLAHAKIKNKIN